MVLFPRTASDFRLSGAIAENGKFRDTRMLWAISPRSNKHGLPRVCIPPPNDPPANPPIQRPRTDLTIRRNVAYPRLRFPFRTSAMAESIGHGGPNELNLRICPRRPGGGWWRGERGRTQSARAEIRTRA